MRSIPALICSLLFEQVLIYSTGFCTPPENLEFHEFWVLSRPGIPWKTEVFHRNPEKSLNSESAVHQCNFFGLVGSEKVYLSYTYGTRD